MLLRRRPATQHGPEPPAPKEPAAGAPPDPAKHWTAEIGWSENGAGPRFVALASDPEGARARVAGSGILDWPPQDPEAVQALARAADELERSLLAAGWASLGQGAAWYAKRFEWQPAAPDQRHRPAELLRAWTSGTGPAPASHRFSPSGATPRLERSRPAPESASPPGRAGAMTAAQPKPRVRNEAPPTPAAAPGEPATAAPPAWPEEATALWRCEIGWNAADDNPRFEAVVFPPGDGRARVITCSQPFERMPATVPGPRDTRLRAAARGLARSLRESGWEVVGRGAGWYAERYVWRGDAEPPTTLDATRKEGA